MGKRRTMIWEKLKRYLKDKAGGRLKKTDICLLAFAMLFSLMLTVSRHIFNLETDISSIDSVYVTDFHWLDLVVWIGTVPAVYILMKAAAFCLAAGESVLFQSGECREKGLWVLFGSWGLLIVLWLPYLFSYWPGGIYSDTVDSIHMALGKEALDNHNPIAYTLLWRAVFWITGAFSGKGEYGGLKLFTVLQTILLAFALSCFIYKCFKWGLHRAFLLLCLLAFGLFPLYPFYGISLWKDTIFSLTVFLFSVFLYQLFPEDRKKLSKRQLAGYCVLDLLIIFLRNNGIYVALFYSVMISLILLWRRRKTLALQVGGASAVLLLAAAVIQGPVYDRYGYNVNRSTESFGIPMQQVAYIVSTDGKVSQQDREMLEKLVSMDSWKELYSPTVADTIKFSPEFDRIYMEENAGEFMRTYLRLALRNPVKAVKAYLLSTMGFWDVFESSSTAYICNFHFGNAEYFMSDYFDYYLDISFHDFAEPKHYISAAVFVWLMLGTVFICLSRRNYKGLIGTAPTLGVWLSVMAATPVAFSFRYVYALFLSVPLYLVICLGSYGAREH